MRFSDLGDTIRILKQSRITVIFICKEKYLFTLKKPSDKSEGIEVENEIKNISFYATAIFFVCKIVSNFDMASASLIFLTTAYSATKRFIACS